MLLIALIVKNSHILAKIYFVFERHSITNLDGRKKIGENVAKKLFALILD